MKFVSALVGSHCKTNSVRDDGLITPNTMRSNSLSDALVNNQNHEEKRTSGTYNNFWNLLLKKCFPFKVHMIYLLMSIIYCP